MAHEEYVAGLRAVADFYEKHPEVDTPNLEMNIYSHDEKVDAQKILRALGSAQKRYSDDMFYIEKSFGPVKLQFVFFRDKVCVRKVIGTEEVPERVIPAHTREIVEWECESLLAEPSKESEG